MKTVTLPIEEYNELLRDQEDMRRLKRELEADASERGFFVKRTTNIWEKKVFGYSQTIELEERSRVTIIARDEVLAEAQKEIDRLAALADELAGKNGKLTMELVRLKGRGFFERLLNKEV